MSPGLPVLLTRFVGRESEISQAAALLSDARLLTLTGPGGAGKTRLALQLASIVTMRFPDGVWFTDLSSLLGSQFVWDEVASTLGVSETGPGSTLAQAVARHLADHSALMVLDNCEHLVEVAAEVAAGLLAAAPGLKVVATSREPLGVGGEVTWVVPPLSDEDGVLLFTDRARHARPQFSLRPDDAEAVRSICRRLDGLPLAIELAAARTRAFAPADIAAGLQDRLDLLPAGPRTAPARQATLQASFDWSYELLGQAERDLLRQCSVFAGGFDLEAATAVCPAAGLEVLASLVDRSLLLVQEPPELDGPRYRMLEPIRQYAARHLAQAGEVERIRTRHRDHYCRLAEAIQPLLLGPEEDRWRARLRTEQDNLRAAMAWSRDQGDGVSLTRMVSALIWFWASPGRITEFAIWVDAAYDRVGELPPGMAARILNFECILAIISRRAVHSAPSLAAEALELARAAGDQGEEGLALAQLGLVAGMTSGADAMRPYIAEALPLARSGMSAMGLMLSLAGFVGLRLFQSNPEETRRLADELVAVAETRGDRHYRLFARGFSGITALVTGRLGDAARVFEGNVSEGRATNDSNYIHSLLGLGWVAMFRGSFQEGRDCVAEAVASARKAGTDSVSITSVEPLAGWLRGWMDLAAGNPAEACQSLAAATAVVRSSPLARHAALPLVVLAHAQLALGELDEASAFLDDAASLAHAGAMTWVLGRVARIRSEMRASGGDLQEAESLAHEAINLAREAGDQLGMIDGLELVARLTARQDRARESVRLAAAAESMRRKLGYVRFPIERGPQDAALDATRDVLGTDDFAAAWAEGSKLSADEAIAYAARRRGERKRPAAGWGSLTPSELEVARLVGEHLTNPEIAARLFVSRATVKTHLVHIFSKLGIDSRLELAAEIARRGLQARPSSPR